LRRTGKSLKQTVNNGYFTEKLYELTLENLPPALQRTTPLPGVSVLELGSGMGLSGMTCAKSGAITTLSDWGAVGDAAALNIKACIFKSLLLSALKY